MAEREWQRDLDFSDDELADMGAELHNEEGASPPPAAPKHKKRGTLRVPVDVVPRREPAAARRSPRVPTPPVPDTATDELVEQALGNGASDTGAAATAIERSGPLPILDPPSRAGSRVAAIARGERGVSDTEPSLPALPFPEAPVPPDEAGSRRSVGHDYADVTVEMAVEEAARRDPGAGRIAIGQVGSASKEGPEESAEEIDADELEEDGERPLSPPTQAITPTLTAPLPLDLSFAPGVAGLSVLAATPPPAAIAQAAAAAAAVTPTAAPPAPPSSSATAWADAAGAAGPTPAATPPSAGPLPTSVSSGARPGGPPMPPPPTRERSPLPVDVIAAALSASRPRPESSRKEEEEEEEEELSGEELEVVAEAPVPPSERVQTPPLPNLPGAPRSAGGPHVAPPPPPEAASATRPAGEAAALRARRRRRAKAWFEEIFDEDYLRTLPFMTPRQTHREADFVESSLELSKGRQILDLGCGYGRHALELAARGYHVVGLDLSLPLLIRAADEAQRRGLAVNFVHGDMRELSFDEQFDAAYCVLTTFGYFDDDTNRKVAQGVGRALRPRGRFLVEVLNRDYLIEDLPTRVWWEGDGCVVLEEVDFNYYTSRVVSRRSVVFEDGRQLEQEISIRAYSLHELGKVLHHAGFRVIEVSGSLATRGRFFGATSRNLLVVAEKRPG